MALSPRSLLLVSPVLIGDLVQCVVILGCLFTQTVVGPWAWLKMSGQALYHFSLCKVILLSRWSSVPPLPLAQALGLPRALTVLEPLIKEASLMSQEPVLMSRPLLHSTW